jgi:hypothetical protein
MLVSLASRLEKTTNELWSAVQPKEHLPDAHHPASAAAPVPADEKAHA